MTTNSARLSGFLSSEKGRRAIIFGGIAVILLLFLSTIIPQEKSGSQSLAQAKTAEETERALEQRLCAVLSEIDGAGSVTVMVTLDSTAQRVFAQDTKSANSGTGSSQSSESSVVLAGSGKEPLEQSVILPRVRGAAVICSGAADPAVKEKIANAAASVLGIGISRVYVTC